MRISDWSSDVCSSDLLPRRMLVGGVLLVMAFAVLVRSFVFTAGYNTTLVADIGVVRAPISGEVDRLGANVGDRVTRNQLLGSFAAPVMMPHPAASSIAPVARSQLSRWQAMMTGLAADRKSTRLNSSH